MTYEIYTFGAPDVLYHILNAIAILFQSQVVNGIIKLSGVSAALYAFYSIWQRGDPSLLYQSFMQPLLVLITILNLPAARVAVVDVFEPTVHSYLIDKVPFVLAFPASVTSKLGKNFQRVVEQLLHTPNSEVYNKRGMLFGSEGQFNMFDLKIKNPQVERNIYKYCRSCIMYDNAFRLYSIDQLKEADDVFAFLEKNASTARTVEFSNLTSKDRSVFNCRQGAAELKRQIETAELPSFHSKILKIFGVRQESTADEFLKYMPFTFRNLTKYKASDDLLVQQLGINGLYNQFSPEKFAQKRAEYLSRANAGILAGIGIEHLVGLKTVMQALIYFSLVFILGMMLMPGKEGVLLMWLGMVAWVDITWPPTYALLHYIMELGADPFLQNYQDMGLSVNSFERMMSFEANVTGSLAWVHAAAAVLSAYVPYVAIALFTGNNWIHLSSNISSPMQTAANVAAGEMTSGNYSFGNTSINNHNVSNESMYQVNKAPLMRAGFNVLDSGSWQRTMSSTQGSILQEKQSQLSSNLQTSVDMVKEVSHQKNVSISTQQALAKMYNDNQQSNMRQVDSFSDFLGNAENYRQDLSASESRDVQDAYASMQNAAKNLSESTGISENEIMRTFVAGSISPKLSSSSSFIGGAVSFLTGASIEASASVGGSKDWQETHQRGISEVANFMQSNEYRDNASKLARVGESWNSGLSTDSGLRSTHDIAASFDQSANLQDQIAETQTKIDSFSQAERNGLSSRAALGENLTQPLVNWALDSGRFDSVQDVQDFLSSSNTGEDKALFLSDFLNNSGHMKQYAEAGQTLTPGDDLKEQMTQRDGEFKDQYGEGVPDAQQLNELKKKNLEGVAQQKEILQEKEHKLKSSVKDNIVANEEEISRKMKDKQEGFLNSKSED